MTTPNVLFVLADDMGWADLGSYGSPDLRTPHLDRLAAEGVRFTDGYATAPWCSQTRIGLYTGRYPARIAGGLPEPIDKPNPVDGLPPEHPTLASLLAGAGYRTALFGKWHCGYLPWFSPTRSGWQEFFGNLAGGMDYYSHLNYHGEHDLYEGETPVSDHGYYTDSVTDRTCEFLGRAHDRPWLLNLNFTTPHWPWEAPGDRAKSERLTARLRAGGTRVFQDRAEGSRAVYAAMVEHLDTSMGRVLDALRATGQDRDTLVVFASDNGGDFFSDQGGLDGMKGRLSEGGIRVPTIAWWPGRIAPRVEATPVVTHDFTATVLALTGVAPTLPLDGADLSGLLLDGTPLAERDLFWRIRDSAALRRGRWKWLRTADGEALYDVVADRGETTDRSAREPALAADLRGSWERTDGTLVPLSS
ncbi:sulfatase-like hydrolase/transferase [Longispora sp. NPDC051575]|uniref:sulfatase-like hydrolase/transferase n=1 Tax=Longispora sp. NPDC051575 TaxID=3154943 RepID=UPI003439B483